MCSSDLPFTMDDEKDVPGGRKNRNLNAGFDFHFASNLHPSGLITTPLPVDKTFEGKMIIFPSWLNHSVSPFYSTDDVRISVAGNIRFTGQENSFSKKPQTITI